jgi:predicted lipid-binding transport protein (Tim44 family)
VSLSDLVTLVVGAVQGVGGIAIFLLIVMIGFCLLLDMSKFRPTRNTRTIKSLDELTGAPIQYLPPNVPRGPSDQLGGSRHAA